MPSQTLHAQPSRGVVAREELRAVSLALRTEALIAGALVLAATALVLWLWVPTLIRPVGHLSVNFYPEIGTPLVLLAFLAPLSVWKSEDPANRAYLWAMPVERSWLHLIKLLSGWLLVMGAMALFLLWVFSLAKLTGGHIGLRLPALAVGGGQVESVQATAAVWEWVVPFTAATISYLLGSILVLSTNHPWRWMGGIAVGLYVVIMLLNTFSWMAGRRALETLIDNTSWVGLLTALLGTLDRYRYPVPGERVVTLPDLSAWLASTALWMGIAIVGVAIVATRHREG